MVLGHAERQGRPMLACDDQSDHLCKQVLTWSTISDGRWVEGLLGGLNCQIERHLFASMPRVKLASRTTDSADFCDHKGISYRQSGLSASYGRVLGHLHNAAPGKPATA